MKALSRTTSLFRLFVHAIRGTEQNFTEGSINRAIFLLAIPMVFEMAAESALALVDMIFISLLKDNAAVTAVGLTESLLAIIYSVAMGLGMASTAMVARRIGEKDNPGAAVAAVNAMYLGLALSVAIGVVGAIYYREALHLMGASEEVVAVGSSFTRLMLGGNITIVSLFLMNAIFRGAGNAAIAMQSLWLANLTNMALDPLLIFGGGPFPGLGVVGAAYATNIGRATGVLYQVYFLLRDKGIIKFKREHFVASGDVMRTLVKTAIGNTLQFVIPSASWIFLSRIIVTFGTAAYAGYQFAIRVIIFTILPSWGMANAAATLVGQNLGANQPDRAERSVWTAGYLNMAFLGVIGILFFFLSDWIIGVFSADPEATRYGIQCLRIVAFGYVFYGFGMVLVQAFAGAGDARTPTIINFFGYWLFQVPMAYALSINLGWGATGAFWAIAIAESAIAVIAILVFRRGKWKTVKI